MVLDPRDRAVKKSYDLVALEELVSKITEASDRGAAIIVEGPKDKSSLRALGANGTIITASQRPLLDVAEDVAKEYDEIVVLTDWDSRGEEMANRLDECLLHTGAQVDLVIRRRLKGLVRKEIKDVESLDTYMEKVRELYGA